MEYSNIKPGIFISRPNRFIARVEIDGLEQTVHVKNTGRCREILTEKAPVYVQQSDKPGRKTKFDLISVYKGSRLINIDSQAPNKVFHEWISKGNLFKNITLIRPEFKYKNSRFDFYVETVDEKALVEVKGVTLEKDGAVLFPDAPTQRGVKHIKELCQSLSEGYKAYVVFVIQMKNVSFFSSNYEMHREFADTLKTARDLGVNVIAVDCDVTENSLLIKDFVKVKG